MLVEYKALFRQKSLKRLMEKSISLISVYILLKRLASKVQRLNLCRD